MSTDSPPTVKVLSSMATRQLLAELAVRWPGGTLQVESVGGVDAARRVAAGESVDVVVLASDTMQRLAAAGHLRSGTLRPFADSPMAIAVAAGAPRPEVGSEAALREAVMRARGIGYSTGPSGGALRALFARWGIADSLAGRLVQAPAGMPVAALLAQGRVEIGFQQRSELLHAPGVDLLGPMPPGLEIVTTFSAAVGTCATSPRAAAAALAWLCGREAAGALARWGLRVVDPPGDATSS